MEENIVNFVYLVIQVLFSVPNAKSNLLLFVCIILIIRHIIVPNL